MAFEGQTNRLLGYGPDARLLIINADDFGVCHAVNEAICGTLAEGIVRSTSLMVPCPAMSHAARFLADHPQQPFGVHLTALSDSTHNRWRPMSDPAKVPSLLDEAGYFYDFEHMGEFMARVSLDQLEIEFRTQIEVVLAAGLRPSQLDWHSLRISKRDDIFDVMFGLAREYGLAQRVSSQSATAKLQSRGLPCVDHDVLDSYGLDPGTRAATYVRLLRELPVGLNEWAVHPGLDTPELLALEPGGHYVRQADYDFFTSREAQDVVQEEGIILLDYRALQAIWNLR